MTTGVAPVIFPDLRDKHFGYVNLAEEARPFLTETGPNLFLDAAYLDKFVARLHWKLGVDYSWGGYLEDRSGLWRGTYLNPAYATHVGIDVFTPAGTALAMKYPGHVAAVFRDQDQTGGWGGGLIVALDKPVGQATHILYAHMAHEISLHEGDVVTPDMTVGYLGTEDQNGGWIEHLHIQALTQNAWDITQGDITKFDGYAARPKGDAHPLFPDPAIFL